MKKGLFILERLEREQARSETERVELYEKVARVGLRGWHPLALSKALRELSRHYLRSGNHTDALKIEKKHLRLDGKNLRSYLGVSLQYQLMGNLKLAGYWLKKALKFKAEDPELAEYLVRDLEIKKALKDESKFPVTKRKKCPGTKKDLDELQEIELEHRRDQTKGRILYEQAAMEGLAMWTPRALKHIFFSLAAIYRFESDYSTARKLQEMGLAIAKAEKRSYMQLCSDALKIGKYKSAYHWLKKAVRHKMSDRGYVESVIGKLDVTASLKEEFKRHLPKPPRRQSDSRGKNE